MYKCYVENYFAKMILRLNEFVSKNKDNYNLTPLTSTSVHTVGVQKIRRIYYETE